MQTYEDYRAADLAELGARALGAMQAENTHTGNALNAIAWRAEQAEWERERTVCMSCGRHCDGRTVARIGETLGVFCHDCAYWQDGNVISGMPADIAADLAEQAARRRLNHLAGCSNVWCEYCLALIAEYGDDIPVTS